MTVALSERILRNGGGFLRDRARRRKIASLLGLGLAVAAPVCGIVTYLLATGNGAVAGNGIALRVLIVIDFCLALALLGVIAWRIGTMIIAKRARSAGSRLHLRMVRPFHHRRRRACAAARPLRGDHRHADAGRLAERERWRVRPQFGADRRILRQRAPPDDQIDASAISQEIERASPFGVPGPREISRALARASAARGLTEIYVINSSGDIIARGPNSYLFLYTLPIRRISSRAVPMWPMSTRIRRPIPCGRWCGLAGVFDAYLYLVRPVDDEAVRVLVETRAMASRYERLEAQRGDIQLLFALLYIGFAVLVLSAAIWFGIWFADRLARPIGRLAGAADRVAKGDLGARVEEERGDDEIATLSRAFNRMTSQVERQRDALLGANAELDQKRRFTEAVLSGVTAGVIGFDPSGRVDLLNAAAVEIVGDSRKLTSIEDLDKTMPGAAPLLELSARAPSAVAEGRLLVVGEESEQEFLVRVACQRTPSGVEGYVMTLDDMTALVSAQRSAAWGDVARRVAHEIRNPLTPIQLSAERLKRKFAKDIPENRPVFEHCVDTIVRQVEQIRRMVEEFSNFARMPTPEFAVNELDGILAEVVDLQAAAHPDTRFERQPATVDVALHCDRGLLSQALTNLLRNAAQSVAARQEEIRAEGAQDLQGRVLIETEVTDGDVMIAITDNGLGLPRRERERLLEPYVTSRKGGTGLGLAIVQRIVDDHAGSLTLGDARGERGARIEMRLPRDHVASARKSRASELGEIPGRRRAPQEAAE